MGLWNKLFGKKYLSWEEYQGKMQQLEDDLWQQQVARRKEENRIERREFR